MNHLTNEAFQPFIEMGKGFQGVALGWYDGAPLALEWIRALRASTPGEPPGLQTAWRFALSLRAGRPGYEVTRRQDAGGTTAVTK